MTIFDVISVIAGVAATSSALQGGRSSAGAHRIVLWTIALVIGVICYFLLGCAFKNAAGYLQSTEPARRKKLALQTFILLVLAIGSVATASVAAPFLLRLIVHAET